jgi:hypothetical protein
VISALAVLETSTYTSTGTSQKTQVFETEKLENGSEDPSDAFPEGRPDNTRHFLWNMRQKFFQKTLPYLGGTLLVFVAIYFLSLYDFINMDSKETQNHILNLGFSCTVGAISLMFSVSPDLNSITNDRSLARQALRNQKGRSWTLYPGLDIFVVYMLLASMPMVITRFISAKEAGSPAPVSILFMLVSGLLLTNVHTAWIHTIISRPTDKSIWQRIPSWREWLAILPAAFLDLILPSSAYYFTKGLMAFLRDICSTALSDWFDEDIPTMAENLGGLVCFLMPYVLELFASTVTRAIYIRVAASMLPDDDEPIVPFDRSFGGRARNARRYCLSIFDAVRTMPLLNWYRCAKIVWGVLWCEQMWVACLFIAIAVETYFLAPDSLIEMLALLVPDAS